MRLIVAPIADAWKSYESKVVPAEAGDVQRQECRRAFMAGALFVLLAIDELGALGDEAAIAGLQALHQELQLFVASQVSEASVKGGGLNARRSD